MTKPEFDDYSKRYLEFRYRGQLQQGVAYQEMRMLERFAEHLFPVASAAVDFESDVVILGLDKWIRANFGPKNQPVAVRTLKRFNRWLFGNGIVRFNWSGELPNAKYRLKPKVRSTITETQFRALQKAALGGWYYWPIVLGWYTGLAVSDACSLRWGEVDMVNCMIRRNRMKTDSLCQVPFERDGELHQMLLSRDYARKHFPRVKINGEDDDPKNDFVDQESAKHIDAEGRASQMSGRLFDQVKKRAGIKDPNLTLHSLRVSFVSRLANANVNVATAMAMTGHKSLEVFQMYVRPTEESLRKGLEIAFQKGP